jgi:hypothetical protein
MWGAIYVLAHGIDRVTRGSTLGLWRGRRWRRRRRFDRLDTFNLKPQFLADVGA